MPLKFPELYWWDFWLRMTKINWSSETSVIWDDGSLVRSASLASWLSLKSQESTYFHIMSTVSKPGLTNTPAELLLRSQTYLKPCYKLCAVRGNVHSICCFFCQIWPVTLPSAGKDIHCLPDVLQCSFSFMFRGGNLKTVTGWISHPGNTYAANYAQLWFFASENCWPVKFIWDFSTKCYE